MTKRLLFLTGTRADFGKLTPLIRASEAAGFEVVVLATGMHLMEKHGKTLDQVHKAGFRNVHVLPCLLENSTMEHGLASTIDGLSRYLRENPVDLLIVHGDRIEALAGALVGTLRNIRVAHVEGGELSGTIDNSIRHSISKLAHFHFVSNAEAMKRLEQMGERPESISLIGCPATEVMLSGTLPDLNSVRRAHDIAFDRYSIALFHPVTTELACLELQVRELIRALIRSERNYLLIEPNNDEGCHYIYSVYEEIGTSACFQRFPTLPFESFATLLINSDFIVGNSSAGVREAPAIPVASINVGTRQVDRFTCATILNVDADSGQILKAIGQCSTLRAGPPSTNFRKSDGTARFVAQLESDFFWSAPLQKRFYPIV